MFNPSQEDKYYDELFETCIQENDLVSEAKEKLVKILKEEKHIDVEPSHLRIREFSNKNPGKIFRDTSTVKQCTVLYPGKSIALQILDDPETVVSDREIVIYAQQFNSDSYTLEKKEELTLNEDMLYEEFKETVAKRFSIKFESLGVLKTSSFVGLDLLEIPLASGWDKPTGGYYNHPSSKPMTISGMPLYLRDGDLILIRDNSVKLKDLTTEEKLNMEKDAKSKKRSTYAYSSYYRKEKALKIHTSED